MVEAIKRSKRSQSHLALLYLDIDRFKFVNDTYGHKIGDGLLVAFAHCLRDSVRASDTVARMGGDEFTIILEGLSQPEDAETVAAKITRSVQKKILIEQTYLDITTSIGIAYCEEGLGAEQLVHLADQAMYRAKNSGRTSIA